MKAHHWDPEVDGPLTAATATSRLQDLGYRCACYTYPPGTVFPEHSHELDKIDLVLKGRFLICMDQREYLLGEGDYLEIPMGTMHRAAVVGDEEVISIDAERLVRGTPE